MCLGDVKTLYAIHDCRAFWEIIYLGQGKSYLNQRKDVLFAMNMLEYAGPNLSEDQRENLEMVYSEVYQLTQLFIEWDWEKYFQEIGSEDAKYSLVNPGIGTV